MMTTHGLVWRTSLPCRCLAGGHGRGGATALSGRSVGPSECGQVGASLLAGRPLIACHRSRPAHNRSAHSSSRSWEDPYKSEVGKAQHAAAPQLKGWRCQSGPNSRTLISARHNQLIPRLAIPCICCLACICHFDHGPPNFAGVTTGPCGSRHFTSLPTTRETGFMAEEFHTLLLVRLHLPLHVDDRFCRSTAGRVRHDRSGCSRVGLLKPRGTPAEGARAMSSRRVFNSG